MQTKRNTILEDMVFGLSDSANDFEQVALEVFAFQLKHNLIYKSFCELQGKTAPQSIEEIPFLPIGFFKSKKIIASGLKEEHLFLSSGTTGQLRSQHPVAFTEVYHRSFVNGYKQLIGNPEDQVILALLPNYLEQGNSSLVFMVKELISQSSNENSGFYLNELADLDGIIQALKSTGKKLVLFGVAYALLDFAALEPDLSGVTIIETGGMKGRRKELLKEELHEALSTNMNRPNIFSEYGMTEMLSQAYSLTEQWFHTPNWLKIRIREVNDPFAYVPEGKSGGINVIDLANIYSCSFFATDDLGLFNGDCFKILGRFDNSDIRGCNLLVN
jgi:hypothetical protein